LQGGMLFEPGDPAEDSTEMKKRPFVTIKLKGKNLQEGAQGSYVYKSVVPIDADPPRKMTNEVAVLTRLAPHVQRRIPEGLREKITLPTIFASREEGPRPYIVENFFTGQPLGTIHTANPATTIDDALAIADVIRAFSGMKQEDVQEIAPALTLKQSRSENFGDNFALWQPALQAALGDGYVQKLAAFLPHAKDPYADLPLQVVAVDINPANVLKDINPANVLKDKDGKLAMIDWERVAVSHNPALDYNFFLASLWSVPDVQRTYLQYVVARNKQNPAFAESLRADYIFNRGCGEINHWTGVKNDESTPQSLQREALLAIDAHTAFLKDAIDRKGIWAPEAAEARQIFPVTL
jgi:hypothetical protein